MVLAGGLSIYSLWMPKMFADLEGVKVVGRWIGFVDQSRRVWGWLAPLEVYCVEDGEITSWGKQVPVRMLTIDPTQRGDVVEFEVGGIKVKRVYKNKWIEYPNRQVAGIKFFKEGNLVMEWRGWWRLARIMRLMIYREKC